MWLVTNVLYSHELRLQEENRNRHHSNQVRTNRAHIARLQLNEYTLNRMSE